MRHDTYHHEVTASGQNRGRDNRGRVNKQQSQQTTSRQRPSQQGPCQQRPCQHRASQPRACQQRASQQRPCQQRPSQQMPYQQRPCQHRASQQRACQQRASQPWWSREPDIRVSRKLLKRMFQRTNLSCIPPRGFRGGGCMCWRRSGRGWIDGGGALAPPSPLLLSFIVVFLPRESKGVD